MANSTLGPVGSVEVSDASYTWIVPNFKSVAKRIWSEIFPLVDNKLTTFQMLCVTENNDGFIEWYLSLISPKEEVTFAMFCVCLVTRNGGKDCAQYVQEAKFTKAKDYWQVPLVKRSTVLENSHTYLKDNHLRFNVNLTVRRDTDLPLLFPTSQNKLDGKLWDYESFSDVVLIVGKKKIKAHKAILANRSSVFEAMFTSERQESKSNRVEIKDTEYDTIEEMLAYMYTDLIPEDKLDSHPMATKLFCAADKYQLNSLKNVTAYFLKQQLTPENAFKTLNLADQYHCAYLKDVTLDYIKKHIKEIVETDGFLELKNMKIELFKETLQKISSTAP